MKGRCWIWADGEVRAGFAAHLKIDTFTDRNDHVKRSKERVSKHGHLRGIVIDMAYDHLLAKNWDIYVDEDLGTFLRRFHDRALTEIEHYPTAARSFVERVVHSQILASYDSFDGLEAALRRIDKRLSKRLRRRECTTDYIASLEKNLDAIEEDFNRFFPQLLAHLSPVIEAQSDGHWLKTEATRSNILFNTS